MKFVILEESSPETLICYSMYDKEADLVKTLKNRVSKKFIQKCNNSRQLFLMTLTDLVTLVVKYIKVLWHTDMLQKTTDKDIYQKLLVSRPVFKEILTRFRRKT